MKIEYIETLPIKTESNSYRNTKELYLPPDENGREIWHYCVKNCILSGRNLHYPNVLLYSYNDSRLYLPYKERTMSLKMGSIYEFSGMEYTLDIESGDCHGKESPIESILDICPVDNLFFFVYNTDNYYHFIYDSIPILISYFHLKKQYPDMKLLMNYPNPDKKEKQEFYKFIIETLEILGLENEYLIINEHTIYKNVFVSTSYTHDFDSNLPPRQEIYDFYKMMVFKALDIVTHEEIQNIKTIKNNNSKLYISRRTWTHNDTSNLGTNYTTRRRLTNEDQLVHLLEGLGYKEVFTENMSMKEKMILFWTAYEVVGAIGGGIANAVFCNRNRMKLVALVSPGFLDVNARFKYSLKAKELVLFDKCYNTEAGEFKTYMRVKHKELPIIGEIEEVWGEKLKVKTTDGSNTGWNADSQYKIMEFDKNEVEPLDNGLNSPWYVDIDSLIKFL